MARSGTIESDRSRGEPAIPARPSRVSKAQTGRQGSISREGASSSSAPKSGKLLR